MNTKLIKPLLKKGKLDLATWLDVLEGLKSEVAPKLPRYKLPTFGELACIGPYSGDRYEPLFDPERRYHAQVFNRPDVRIPDVTGHTSYSLSDQAISYFSETGQRVKSVVETRSFYAWGLTKHAYWVLLEISVEGMNIKDKLVEVPYKVVFQNVSLAEMLEKAHVTPASVLSSISLEVDRYAARKRMISEDATKFAADVRALGDTILHGFI